MSFSNYETTELIEYLPEALFLEDGDGKILDVNSQACELLGYSKGELINQDVDKIVPEGAPVYLPGEIDEATRAGKPIETVNLSKDGTEVPVELRGRILEVEGNERVLVSIRDISERKEANESLNSIEWMLSKKSSSKEMEYTPEYGDVSELNKDGLILTSVGKDHLKDIVSEYLDLLETSAAVYEKNGDYALGMFSSGWCRLMDSASRRLCDTEDNQEALDSGRWLCHESCWKCSYRSMKEGQAVENTCVGGIKLYAVPVHVNGETVGSINFGYGNPPTDEAELKRLSEKFSIPIDKLRKTAKEYNSRPQFIIDYAKECIKIAAKNLGYFIERKQAERALEGERNKLRNLHDSVDKLQQQESEEDVLNTAIDVAETMLDFEICAIDILEGDYLVPRYNSALDPEETTTSKIGEGIAGKTVQRGETIWGEDVRQHPDAKPTKSEWRAFISVPIGELGVIQVISEEVGSFTEQEVELAEILAGHLREEIMRVRLEKELRQQAIRDPLTDLYNRRYFNETLKKEVDKSQRYDRPIAFLMIDVNRFKEMNDRYSHQTGDEVLQEVAGLLKGNVRDADSVVRYGGDEFLVMMPETNGGATSTVDRLQEELDRWNKR